jgi:hypothetical protein
MIQRILAARFLGLVLLAGLLAGACAPGTVQRDRPGSGKGHARKLVKPLRLTLFTRDGTMMQFTHPTAKSPLYDWIAVEGPDETVALWMLGPIDPRNPCAGKRSSEKLGAALARRDGEAVLQLIENMEVSFGPSVVVPSLPGGTPGGTMPDPSSPGAAPSAPGIDAGVDTPGSGAATTNPFVSVFRPSFAFPDRPIACDPPPDDFDDTENPFGIDGGDVEPDRTIVAMLVETYSCTELTCMSCGAGEHVNCVDREQALIQKGCAQVSTRTCPTGSEPGDTLIGQ